MAVLVDGMLILEDPAQQAGQEPLIQAVVEEELVLLVVVLLNRWAVLEAQA